MVSRTTFYALSDGSQINFSLPPYPNFAILNIFINIYGKKLFGELIFCEFIREHFPYLMGPKIVIFDNQKLSSEGGYINVILSETNNTFSLPKDTNQKV